MASHSHTIPEHTHEFEGQLASTAISGGARGQEFSGQANLNVTGTAEGQKYLDRRTESHGTLTLYNPDTGLDADYVTVTHRTTDGDNVNITIFNVNKYLYSESSKISGSAKGTVEGEGKASLVTGHVSNGKVNGATLASNGNLTDAYGDLETAPDHTYIKYIMKVRPYPVN